jgi:hypothetical protein
MFRETVHPDKAKEQLMKKILVTAVLGIVVLVLAARPADAAQPLPAPGQAAQGQAASPAPAAAPQAPVIKDPAEYNAYMGAIEQKDPAARISGLEAYLTQYPNSVMKIAALQTLMQDYQQTNNQAKTIATAEKLVAADPCNVRGLALLAFVDRLKAQGGDTNAKQDLVDAKKYGDSGLECLPKFTKPQGTSDTEYDKMKNQMTGIFDAAIGIADLTDKDYDGARKALRAAADSTPDEQKDFSVIYPLALAYAGPTPPDPKINADPMDAIWFSARASAVAPNPQYQQQIAKYAESQYDKYHGGDDGWADVLGQAKANGDPPAGFAIKPAPTPAEQAHNMVASTSPDKMDFATWQFIFTNGSKADQDTVWNAIKGKAVQMNGTVIHATTTEFDIAGSSDDIDAKKPDITLTFPEGEKVPVKLVPKDGASLDFQGEPSSYTSAPFMMTMDNGKLLKAASPTPTRKPVHHNTASQ